MFSLSSDHSIKDGAHPESGPPRRQSAFSVDAASDAKHRDHAGPSLEAGPDSLPSSYRQNRLWCIARDPGTLYCYWQLALPVDRFPGARLAVAVHRSDGTHESTTLVNHPAGARFIDVSSSGTLYQLTLGFLPPGKFSRADMLFVVAQQSVRTPRDFAVVQTGDHAHGRGILSARGGHSPSLLALLFPDLAFGGAASGSPSGAHPARTPRHRIPHPPERGGFLPPHS